MTERHFAQPIAATAPRITSSFFGFDGYKLDLTATRVDTSVGRRS